MELEGYLLCFRSVRHWKVLEIWDVTGVGKAACLKVWATLFDRKLHSDKESMSTLISQEIERGEYQIVFVSPEALFFGTQWRPSVYCLKLVGFVVDETHWVRTATATNLQESLLLIA